MSKPPTDNIFVINRQRRFSLNLKEIKRLARFVLKQENKTDDIGINLMFVANNKIKEFNKKFLNCDKPTDVISFEGDQKNCSAGDVVISVQKAAEYAAENDINFEEEVARYIIHGILHCLGYDDLEAKNKRLMFNRQEKILKTWVARKREGEIAKAVRA